MVWDSQHIEVFIYILYILIIFDPHFIYNLVFFGLPWFLFLCYAAQVAWFLSPRPSHVESSERSLSGPSCGWAVGAWSECGENCGPQQREAAEHAERGSWHFWPSESWLRFTFFNSELEDYENAIFINNLIFHKMGGAVLILQFYLACVFVQTVHLA